MKNILNLLPYPLHLFLWRTKEIVLYPYFLLTAAIIVPTVFILEKIIPAKHDQKVFSISLFQDFIWFNFDFAFRISFFIFFMSLLKLFYQRYLYFLTVPGVQTWPMVLRVIISYVVGDFLAWFHHFARHKVKPFWFFHSIHHSQRETNLLTEARRHVMEHLIAAALIFIPSLMLQINFSAAIGLVFFHEWYKHIYHANLKTNYGFLKYFLVTPQAHRIHHSMKPEHQDKNFGVIFTFWDRAFGTLHKDYDEYPQTGIEDPGFPLENRGGIFTLSTYLRQSVYPFRLLLRKKRRTAEEELCQKSL